jgi:hypothetical protein
MGNNAWSGYSADDKNQACMETGDCVKPRLRSKRDNNFYGHMTRKSMNKNCKMVKEGKC